MKWYDISFTERYLNLKPRRCNFCNGDIDGASLYCDTIAEKCIVVTMKGKYYPYLSCPEIYSMQRLDPVTVDQ